MKLKVGDIAPQFTAQDTLGNLFFTEKYIGKKTVVLYFYPKDNTPGCTAQACSFRDQYQDFVDHGAEVIGVSGDSYDSHKKFANRHKLPFTLLSDSNKSIRKLYDVPSNLFGLIPGRVTFVIDKNGIIQMIFDSVMATTHISKALKLVKELS
jgi:thioredoxin-dependent peroxiredoxin